MRCSVTKGKARFCVRSFLLRAMGDLGGAFGDLGVSVPYFLGVIWIAGLSPLGVLLGFALFLIVTGLIYRLPVAVQPMKAIAALLLVGEMGPEEAKACGILVGVALLLIGCSGGVARLARMIPLLVVVGLQAGLGLVMVWMGGRMLVAEPVFAVAALVLLLVMARLRVLPLAPVILVGLSVGFAELAGFSVENVAVAGKQFAWELGWALPDWHVFIPVLEPSLLAQLPLTLVNAIIVTSLLASELFPDGASRVTTGRLTVSTALGNLLLVPFGAMPMCHGAGGLQAQHRFGARTGAAPVLLGCLLLGLLFFAGEGVLALLAWLPHPVLGVLLVYAGGCLILSKRLLEARPVSRFVIAATALLTFTVSPAVGLVGGFALERLRLFVQGRGSSGKLAR